MAHVKINKTFLDRVALPVKTPEGKASQIIYRDTQLPAFAVRIGSGGAKTFFVEKRVNGRLKKITIGRFGQITAEQARQQAQAIMGEVAIGLDPLAERRAKAAQSVTLSQAFDAYKDSRKDLKPGTIKNYTKCIDGCFSDWKARRLVDITKDMIQIRHREIGKRAPQRANNAMRVLRAIFNHAMHSYEDADGNSQITVNPVSRLSNNREWYPTKRRQSVLKPHELKAWYEATGELAYTTSRDFLRVLLFTGLRKMEAATLTWGNIDFKDKTLVVPDTKNREPHTLPLSDFLYQLLKHRYDERTSDIWVFPSDSTQGQPHLTEPRAAVLKVTELSGLPFTLHDLRRTFITVAESLDVSAYALKRLANHRMINDVTAGYIITDVERLRPPMQRVTNFLLQQIESE